jgi:hypothetical protein
MDEITTKTPIMMFVSQKQNLNICQYVLSLKYFINIYIYTLVKNPASYTEDDDPWKDCQIICY